MQKFAALTGLIAREMVSRAAPKNLNQMRGVRMAISQLSGAASLVLALTMLLGIGRAHGIQQAVFLLALVVIGIYAAWPLARNIWSRFTE